MKLLICGDRNWTDRQMIRTKLVAFKGFNGADHTVMHGDCAGADLIAGEEAAKLGFRVEAYPANWHAHGRAAGPIRNRFMLEQQPTLVWAFHDSLSASRGTRNMVEIAQAAGVKVVHFIHEIEVAVPPQSQDQP